MHLFNKQSLMVCFNARDGKKAVGIDGVDKETYKENLDANLKDLTARLKRMAYRPNPVRQVQIDRRMV